MTTNRLKFGIFMAPFHRAGENPTLALERDLQLIEHLDRLGFEEAWIGEHHSAGWEIIADPAIFIAAAAARTRHIKLGTGVTSLPYHHPLMVADRMVMLDHLTRGRAMLGVGPGALTSDAYMMGIEATTQRPRMDEALAAIMALLRGEVVNMHTDWFTLREARLQIANYTEPHLPVAVAASFSPAGPTAAGKYGIGLLSVATHQPGGLEALKRTWSWVEEAYEKAAEESAGSKRRASRRRNGAAPGPTPFVPPPPNRADWRIVMPFHLADSRDEAIEQVKDGYMAYAQSYFAETLGRPMVAAGQGLPTPREAVEAVIARGGAIIGTPDDAVEAVERLLDMSGGFGGIMFQAHEWASTPNTLRSFELWARYVAPRFQAQTRTLENRDWVAANRATIFAENTQAIANAFTDAGKELPSLMQQRLAQRRPGIL
ncbi:MAG TPA: LLM class flavin-dependent oxidoreductase [Dehalococcoidia bacterium]|nr:LLM class flavin-dependent oxidoreductase [Dehalococcoidia bacterium]